VGVGRSLTVIVVIMAIVVMPFVGMAVFMVMVMIVVVMTWNMDLIQLAVDMEMFVIMVTGMDMIPMRMMVMRVPRVLPFDSCFAFTTATYGTHQSTSSSLIRSSSPPVICN